MKFSIITPVWNRADKRLTRCIESVQRQIYPYNKYEHIIVDDGSEDGTDSYAAHIIEGIENHCKVGLLKLPENNGRVLARNVGMQAAAGEWIVWLDSDDALDPMYLATFDYFIENRPAVNLWVCGAVVHGVKKKGKEHIVPIWTKIRDAWMPPPDESDHAWVHGHFPSGTVGTGMFVFRRSCLETTNLLPPWRDHCEVADGIDDWLGYETGYSCESKWVGNPWGDDYAMFRKLTQFFQVGLVNAALYVHYVR